MRDPHLEKPPDYSARRQQYRLIALVFCLLLVLFLTVEASKAKNWRWLFADEAPVAQSDESTAAENPDTKLGTPVPRRTPLGDGVFVSPADLRGGSEEVVAVAPQPTKGAAGFDPIPPPTSGKPTAPSTSPGTPPTPGDYAAVKDDTVFRSAEAVAWYGLLSYLNEVEPNKLRAASFGPVSFVQLHESPTAFRGRVVDLAGDVRRAHYLEAPKNDYGIEGYWQCWLFPSRSQNPIVVYALKLPEGFPQGMKLSERVELVGVFFKRWAYASKSGSRVAPLVVAGSADWYPANMPKAHSLPGWGQLALVLAGCALFATAMAWLVNRLTWWSRPQLFDDDTTVTVAPQVDDDLKSVEQATEGFLGDLESGDTYE